METAENGDTLKMSADPNMKPAGEQTELVKNNEIPEGDVEDDGKIVFPPPNSWYRPHVATSREDMWAYIGLNLVVVVKPRKNTGQKTQLVSTESTEEIHKPETDGGLWPQFTMVGIQRDKYSSISFCQAKYEDLPLGRATLVTGCEGGFVRLWDVSKNATLAFHDNHKKPVCGVQWSPRDYTIVYSVDEEGFLTMWNLKKNSLLSMSFGKLNPTCLSVSPSEDNIIALGTKSGNIFIIETVGNGKILHKMRHEEEVINVNWRPEGNWGTQHSFNQQKKSNDILVSSIFSVKSSTIRVWDRHGKDMAILGVWEKDQKDLYAQRKITKYFNTTCWVKDPNTNALMLVTAGRHGEIIAFTEGTVPNEIHRIHSNSFVFGIIQFGDVLWTLSYEPIIVGWNLRTSQVECIIPTFRGIASIMSSPVEATRVVVGGVDSCIRVLSLQQGYPELTSVKPPTVTHRMKGKISAVAWHPNRENKIGFGTDEGVLGIYEWKEDNKFAVLFNRRVSGTVYTVDWGPPCHSDDLEPAEGPQDKPKDTYMLYCCGGQSVYMIHPSKHTNALINVSKIIERSNPGGQDGISVQDKASEIRWSPDRNYLAVGYADGRIELYAPPNLKMKCWIKCHGRAIQFFSWRSFDFLDENKDTKDRWFASASNDGTTRLFNLEELFRDDFKNSNEVEPVQIISSAATLQGHQGLRVIWLSWSPHNKDLLVTCSYDRTAIVWNVKDGSQISRYMEHQHRLVACMFHPADPYKVISCSDELSLDFTVHVWDYRKHPFRPSAPKQIKSSVKSDPLKAVREDASADVDAAVDGYKSTAVTGTGHIVQLPDRKFVMLHPKAEEKVKSKLKAKSRTLLPTTSNGLINSKVSLNHELRYIVDKTKIPLKVKDSTAQEVEIERSLPKAPQDVEDSISDIVSTSSRESEENSGEDPALHLGILGSAEECKKLVTSEMKHHRGKENWKAMLQLSEWMGSSPEFIREAIAAGQVNETVICSAAAVSRKLYLEAIKAYVNQLKDGEEYYQAVHYLLLSNQLEEALELLMSKKMFRDAAAVAKLRLPPSDPFLIEVNEKWIYQMLCDGNFELAAKIYCSMNRYSEALTVIEKRNTAYAWKAGVYIASKANDTKKVEMLGIKYIQDSLAKRFYDECFELIKEFPVLQCMLSIVLVHQCLQGAVSSLEGISSAEDFNLWNEVMADFGEDEEVKESFKSYKTDSANDDLQKKIKSLLQLALPQNSAEAQQIIVKNIVLILLSDEDRVARALECYSLAKIWCEEKDPLLFCSVSTIVRHLVPEWKNEDSILLSVSVCQTTAALHGAHILLKKIKTECDEDGVKDFQEKIVQPAVNEGKKISSSVDTNCKDKLILSCVSSIDNLIKEIAVAANKTAGGGDNAKLLNVGAGDGLLQSAGDNVTSVPLPSKCENGTGDH